MGYEKTLWKTGDVVTEEKMNKIEQGIKSVELPSVTATDDGKVLTVVDGEWVPGEASGGGSADNDYFIVRFTPGDYSTFTADKTFSEVQSAIEDGKIIKGFIWYNSDNYKMYNEMSYIEITPTEYIFHPINLLMNGSDLKLSIESIIMTSSGITFGDTYIANITKIG